MVSIWPMPVARAAPRIPSFGKKTDSPDQERVQDDVAGTSHQQGDHRYFHPSYSLEKFFEEKADGNYCGKQENDGRILQSHSDHGFILGIHLKEYGHNSDADHSHQDSMDHRQKNPWVAAVSAIFCPLRQGDRTLALIPIPKRWQRR